MPEDKSEDSELKSTARWVFSEVKDEAEKELEGYDRMVGKTVMFNIRDTDEAFAMKNAPEGPKFTEDPDEIPDDAGVVHVTENSAKQILRGAVTPEGARYKYYAEDDEPMLYLTDIEFNRRGDRLSAPKELVWLYAMSLFEMLQGEVRGMFRSSREESKNETE